MSWKNMLDRCYGKQNKNLHPAYFEISEVCDEWLNFQTFADWYEEKEYKVEGRLHLDKDILYPGNKIYSPDKCLLVPQYINELFTCKPKDNGLPVGISMSNSGKFVATYNRKHLGTYPNLLEAYEVYAKAKETVIKRIANDFKEIIPNDIYEILMNYRVLIENDKNYMKK